MIVARTQRLFTLMQILRRHRYPVTAQVLAQELEISVRTLYRDIATLQAQGAHIEGEAGLGYVLRPDFVLPPLMFSQEEIEALVLGARWVGSHTDKPLGQAATDALAKIAAVLPAEARHLLDSTTLLIPARQQDDRWQAELRQAMRAERKVLVDYADAQGRASQRILWPFALGYFEQVRVVVAWCELRQDFRHFRVDRILSLQLQNDHFPQRRANLLTQWRAEHLHRPREAEQVRVDDTGEDPQTGNG
ncbi:transcriptional regulator [Pokkaliibacter plantistimulans]|uniref:Transcriptional regulator n=1 Tax=Proteobacteria bacterium 228 TaxID=2083153 RepID=A0A2S5KPZ7_9PROT|nr:transcriptional regulator [Pokkaliibacter plantistimulans]